MSHNAHNSAHSSRWRGPTSRGRRLASKLGRAVSLKKLERLLRERPKGRVS